MRFLFVLLLTWGIRNAHSLVVSLSSHHAGTTHISPRNISPLLLPSGVTKRSGCGTRLKLVKKPGQKPKANTKPKGIQGSRLKRSHSLVNRDTYVCVQGSMLSTAWKNPDVVIGEGPSTGAIIVMWASTRILVGYPTKHDMSSQEAVSAHLRQLEAESIGRHLMVNIEKKPFSERTRLKVFLGPEALVPLPLQGAPGTVTAKMIISNWVIKMLQMGPVTPQNKGDTIRHLMDRIKMMPHTGNFLFFISFNWPAVKPKGREKKPEEPHYQILFDNVNTPPVAEPMSETVAALEASQQVRGGSA